MKITQQQSENLLSLVQIDQKVNQLQQQIQLIISGADIADLRLAYSAMASELLTARNQFESNQTELKRAEADLATVEQRIAKDKERLNASSSAKDIQGIESELITLSKRRSDLEDAELELLENQDDLQSQLDEIGMRHRGASDALSSAETAAEKKLLETRSEVDVMINERSKLHAQLGTELATIYDRRAAKGIAAGRLVGGECGACRMQLGAVDLDHLLGAAQDDLIYCPECQAVLVR
ncbi:MAG: C4-type zinc ribbon domain-containing protein [Actinomycetes bacterium]